MDQVSLIQQVQFCLKLWKMKKEFADQAFLESDDNIEEVLHKYVDEVINLIFEVVLNEEDINYVFFEEDPIVVSSEAYKTIQ